MAKRWCSRHCRPRRQLLIHLLADGCHHEPAAPIMVSPGGYCCCCRGGAPGTAGHAGSCSNASWLMAATINLQAPIMVSPGGCCCRVAPALRPGGAAGTAGHTGSCSKASWPMAATMNLQAPVMVSLQGYACAKTRRCGRHCRQNLNGSHDLTWWLLLRWCA